MLQREDYFIFATFSRGQKFLPIFFHNFSSKKVIFLVELTRFYSTKNISYVEFTYAQKVFQWISFKLGSDKDFPLLPSFEKFFFFIFLFLGVYTELPAFLMSAAINMGCYCGCCCLVIRLKASVFFCFCVASVSRKIDNFESEASLKIKDKRGGWNRNFCGYSRVDLAGK